MSATTKRTLVLDLDGTLADTVLDLIPVLNRVTAPEGLPAIEMKNVGHVVGHGARRMIERAFSFHRRPLQTGQLDRLFDLFIEDYRANIALNTVLFDGAEDALERFAKAGWLLAVCTNKQEDLSRKLLEELGVMDRFAALTGGDTFTFRKPDPRHLIKTVELAGGSPQGAIMVGDSVTDIDTALAAKIPVVAVDFGYSDRPVGELGPQAVISSFSQLWETVAAL
ncbi:MAG: HAD-IA family hydrolase [Rhizobiaceae bacterium]